MPDEIVLSPEQDRNAVLENTIKEEAKNYSVDHTKRVRAIKRHFVKTVVDYDGGCVDSKARFLIDCGLEDYLPTVDYEIKVTFSLPYGTDAEEEGIENAFHDAVYAVDGSSPYVDIYATSMTDL